MKEYLYTPLKVGISYKSYKESYDDSYWYDELYSTEAVEYQPLINEAINNYLKIRIIKNDKEIIKDEELMNYFDEYDCEGNKELERSIKEKIISTKLGTVVVNNSLYGVMEMEVKESLATNEINLLKKYFSRQYSDGWGEGFEQRPIETSEGEMYVKFWSSDNFFMDTKEEFEERLGCQLQSQNDFKLPDNNKGMKFNM